MPANTPTYRLPYPLDGDPAWETARHFQRLAERIERVLEGFGGPSGAGGGLDTTTREKLNKAVAYVEHRPINLAARAPELANSTTDAAPAIRAALAESPVVELPAGTTWTLGSGAITLEAGQELRGGPGTVLQTTNRTTPYIRVHGGTLADITINHGNKAGTTGVHIADGETQSRLYNVTVIGANRGITVGPTAGSLRGPAVAPLLEGCNVIDAGEYGYLFDQSTGATMIDCRGNGAALDIIKLRTKVRQLRIIGGEFSGAGRHTSAAGDGLDGFAGAEDLYIGGGAWFHDNAGNGIALKTDDDSTGTQTVEAYREANGKPRRMILDGFSCTNNTSGNGLTIHRSDDSDSDVLTAHKPLPHLRDFIVSNAILARNAGRGLLLNARYGQVSDLVCVRNNQAGVELLREARDIRLSGIRAIANGIPNGVVDGFVLAGRRIIATGCTAHGVDVDAVSDDDLDAVEQTARHTRYGFRIMIGSQVRLDHCGAYHCKTAGLSDIERVTPMTGCDWRNPDGSPQFTGGVHVGKSEVIGWRGGPYLRRSANGGIERSANGRTGWTAI